MLCVIDQEIFHMSRKITWIEDSGASCHTNDCTGLLDITVINELIQGSLGNMPPIKKGKFHAKVHQVGGTEQLHTIWPMKKYPKAGENLFSLHANSHKGTLSQVTTRATLRFTLPKAISS